MGDIVKYQADDGSKLEREWFLQVLEAAANVLVGLAGLILTQGGPSPQIPYKSFLLTGSTQVLAKAMTQKAQIYGVPFFLATLVKNAKMVPVMIGAIVLSGTRYPARKWCQVGMIIGGVVLVTVGKSKAPSSAAKSDTENLGLLCLALSLTCDGITGGQQTAFKKEYKKTQGKGLAPYDLMLFTNFAMLCIAVAASLALVVGILNGVLPLVRANLAPLVSALSMVPPLAILPILFIVFGLGELSKVMLIVIGTAPIMMRDVAQRVRELPGEQLIKIQTLGANSWQVITRMALPQVLPRLIDAVRLSLGPAWLFLIAAEAIASTEGLGYRIFLVRRYLAMDVILPYVAWITFLAFAIDFALARYSRWRYPWFHQAG